LPGIFHVRLYALAMDKEQSIGVIGVDPAIKLSVQHPKLSDLTTY